SACGASCATRRIRPSLRCRSSRPFCGQSCARSPGCGAAPADPLRPRAEGGTADEPRIRADAMRFRLPRFVMAHRGAVTLGFVLVTLFFMAGIPKVEIRTIFNDLLPTDDPFVQVYLDH